MYVEMYCLAITDLRPSGRLHMDGWTAKNNITIELQTLARMMLSSPLVNTSCAHYLPWNFHQHNINGESTLQWNGQTELHHQNQSHLVVGRKAPRVVYTGRNGDGMVIASIVLPDLGPDRYHLRLLMEHHSSQDGSKHASIHIAILGASIAFPMTTKLVMATRVISTACNRSSFRVFSRGLTQKTSRPTPHGFSRDVLPP